MNKFSALCVASMLGFMTLTTNCNNSTNPSPPKPLQLLQPVAGKTFKVGSPVTIQWKINDSTKISTVEVDLSIDSGKTFPMTIGDQSFLPETTSITWTPTQAQASTGCVVKVKSYVPPYLPDQSGIFTVSN
jgi:hypothetical protein